MNTILRMQFDPTKRLPRGRKGQAQIEFLLSVLLTLVLVVGIAEMIALIYTYTVLAHAAKEGVRYAIVHGCDLTSGSCSGTCPTACTDTTGTNVSTYARAFLGASLHDPSAFANSCTGTAREICVTYPDGGSQPLKRVRVTIHYPYAPFFGLGWPTVTVHAAAEGRIFY
jgi:TadE-like protein